MGAPVVGSNPSGDLSTLRGPWGGSVGCAWRGIARTAEQRADAIRLWPGLAPGAVIPEASYVEALFMVVLDTFDPHSRDTAKAKFLASARGGESMEYLFLTCFADWTVR